VKKGGTHHPDASFDAGADTAHEDAIEKETEEDDSFGASLVIGAILIIPVLAVTGITVFLRLKRRGIFFYPSESWLSRTF
jgi:hypothetical protein